jgi:hypothetical protein
MEQRIYKIQHKTTQLYSRGGAGVGPTGRGPGWNKQGKVWTSMGHLRNHLTQYEKRGDLLADWQVITYSVSVEKVVPAVEELSAASIVRMLKS